MIVVFLFSPISENSKYGSKFITDQKTQGSLAYLISNFNDKAKANGTFGEQSKGKQLLLKSKSSELLGEPIVFNKLALIFNTNESTSGEYHFQKNGKL